MLNKIPDNKELVFGAALRLAGAKNDPVTVEAREQSVKILTTWEHCWRNFLCVETLMSYLCSEIDDSISKTIIEWMSNLKTEKSEMVKQSLRRRIATKNGVQVRLLSIEPQLSHLIDREILLGLEDGRFGPILPSEIRWQCYPDQPEISMACSFLATSPLSEDFALMTKWLIEGLHPFDILDSSDFRAHVINLAVSGDTPESLQVLLTADIIDDRRFVCELPNAALIDVPKTLDSLDRTSTEFKKASCATGLLAYLIKRWNLATPGEIREQLASYEKPWLFAEMITFLTSLGGKNADNIGPVMALTSSYHLRGFVVPTIASTLEAIDSDQLVGQCITHQHPTIDRGHFPGDWLADRIRKNPDVYLSTLFEAAEIDCSDIMPWHIEQLLKAFDGPNEALRGLIDKWVNHGYRTDQCSRGDDDETLYIVDKIREFWPEMGLGRLINGLLLMKNIALMPHELNSVETLKKLLVEPDSNQKSLFRYPIEYKPHFQAILLAKCGNSKEGRAAIVHGLLAFGYRRDGAKLKEAVSFLRSDPKFKRRAIGLAKGLFEAAWPDSAKYDSLAEKARELILSYPDGIDWLGESGHKLIRKWFEKNWLGLTNNYLEVLSKILPEYLAVEFLFERLEEQIRNKVDIYIPTGSNSVWVTVIVEEVETKKGLMQWLETNHRHVYLAEIIETISAYDLANIGKARVFATLGLNYNIRHPEFPAKKELVATRTTADWEKHCSHIRELCVKILNSTGSM